MITGVHISSSEVVINRDSGKKSNLPKLLKNQIVNAKVLDVLPKGKAMLLVDGRKVTAKTAMLLTPGEQIALKVVSQKDALVLKLIEPVQTLTAQRVSSLISFFAKNESIPDITGIRLAQVKDLLMDMSLKSDKPDIDFLPKIIEKSGMTWERKIALVLQSDQLHAKARSQPPAHTSAQIKSKLNLLLEQDVKANILKEMFNVGQGAELGKSDAFKTSAAFLETLENFQLLNHHSSESGRYLLPFPIFSESGFRFGQLLVDTGKNAKSDGKEGDKLIRISFLLDMTRLGPLRADFSILKKEISGRFGLTDQDTCDYLASMIPALKTRLEDTKYHVRNIECVLIEKKEVQPNSLIQTLVKAGDDRVVNLVV